MEVRESAREAAVDALVVAKLEVQAVVVRVAAPVVAVERVAIFEEERQGADLAVARRDAKLQTFAELCRPGLQAAQGQIRLLPAHRIGTGVELEQAPPFVRTERIAGAPADREVRELAPLGADVLALLARQARSEEHTSELPSLMRISYAVFCLKNKT